MDNETSVVDATVVPTETSVVNPSLDAIKAQKVNFQAQLDQVKANMQKYQQAFENEKVRGIKLEGALESLEFLLKSLSK